MSGLLPFLHFVIRVFDIHMLIRNGTDISLPVSLEQELHENFNDVTMRTVARIPVILRVGTSHIRVTSVNAIAAIPILYWLRQIKSLPVSPGLSCQSTELIPLTDVSDIYNVSTGHDLHEFIIRRRQGVTVYFSSPSREKIVKVKIQDWIGCSFCS